jgi:hypothetical protein
MKIVTFVEILINPSKSIISLECTFIFLDEIMAANEPSLLHLNSDIFLYISSYLKKIKLKKILFQKNIILIHILNLLLSHSWIISKLSN